MRSKNYSDNYSKFSIMKFLSLSWAVFIFSFVVQADEPIRFLAADFPPYEIENSENGLKGFDIEVVEAAFAEVAIHIEIEFIPWARSLIMVEKGEVAGMLSCVNTPARRKIVIFSDPLSKASLNFMVRQNYKGKQLKKLEDLRGVSVGAVRGYGYAEEMKDLKSILFW